MTQLDIRQFPCLKDNYGVLIHDPEQGVTAAIDAPDAAAVKRALDDAGWTLSQILVTHHHADHTAGIPQLVAETGCKVVGPRAEAARIPNIGREVGEGDVIVLGGFEVRVLDTPGHTMGHVSYFVPAAKVAFVGDTLFAMGCGRVLEGTAQMMWGSLEKIAALPGDTEIYCGHEYTLANAEFGLSVEPENVTLRQRAHDVEALRSAGRPCLPTKLSLELETNVFLRVGSPQIRERVKLAGAPNWKVFADLRERKNKF